VAYLTRRFRVTAAGAAPDSHGLPSTGYYNPKLSYQKKLLFLQNLLNLKNYLKLSNKSAENLV
jgi:hypothetical protein